MPPIRTCLILTLIFFHGLYSHPVFPQDSIVNSAASIATYNMFREPSTLMFGSGFGNLEPLIFEGDLVPYFMLSINRNVRWGIELSPRIRLRMYNKKSYPIRTPSYIPRITFFYQLVDQADKKRDVFTYCSIYHHSNGQEGDFYTNNGTTINTKSGSFSANWIEAGAFLSRPAPYLPYIINYFKLYAAYNFSQETSLNGIYGRWRFYGDFQSNLNLSKLFRVSRQTDKNHKYLLTQSIRLGWIAGELDDTRNIDRKRLIFQYTVSFMPSFLTNVTLIAQYYYGEDYYNIYFNRTLNVLRFGIASKINIFN